jgi:hypothetical protein
MMRYLILLLLTGCAAVPTVNQSGLLTCVRVETFTTTTTTVYVAATAGTVVVHPDCTVAVHAK